MRTVWLVTMILGFVLEGAGFVLAARGLLQTWRANANGRQFFSPRLQRIITWVRVHVLHRTPRMGPGPSKNTLSADLSIPSASGTLRLEVTDEMTLEEKMRVIHNTATDALAEAHAAQAAVEDEARKRRTDVARMEAQLSGVQEVVTDYAKGLVVDGVPLAIAGLVCAATGLALQAAASIARF